MIDTTDATTLDAHIRKFTMDDVLVFVSTGNTIRAYDLAGNLNYVVNQTTGGDYAGISLGDLDMRPDGRLFTYAGINNNNGNAGRVAEVDPGDGTFVQQSDDEIANRAAQNPTSWQTNTNTVLSFAFDLNPGDGNLGDKYEELYLIIQDGNNPATARSKLYRAADGGGVDNDGVNAQSNQALADPSPDEGYRGAIQVRRDAEGNFSPTGTFTDEGLLVTGLQFRGESNDLVGVSADGLLLQGINPADRPDTTEQGTEFFTNVDNVLIYLQLPGSNRIYWSSTSTTKSCWWNYWC